MSVDSEDIYRIVERDDSLPSYHDKKVDTEKFGETEVSLFYIDIKDPFHVLRYSFEEDVAETLDGFTEFYEEGDRAYTVLDTAEEAEAVEIAENLLEALDSF